MAAMARVHPGPPIFEAGRAAHRSRPNAGCVSKLSWRLIQRLHEDVPAWMSNVGTS